MIIIKNNNLLLYENAKYKCEKELKIDNRQLLNQECEIISFPGKYVNAKLNDGFIFNQLRFDFEYFWKLISNKNEIQFIKNEFPMIRDNHPDRHHSLNEKHLKYIGYWASNPNILLDEFAQRECFLSWPENFIDNNWSEKEAKAVCYYLEEGKTLFSWKGYSYCRICNYNRNGTKCLTDDVFVWPSGFSHYVIEHKVKPPQEFIDHVLNNQALL